MLLEDKTDQIDLCEKVINECRALIECLGDERVEFVEFVEFGDASGYKLSKRVGAFTLTITIVLTELTERDGWLGVCVTTCGNAEFEMLPTPNTPEDICRTAYKVVGLGHVALDREIRSLGQLLGGGK